MKSFIKAVTLVLTMWLHHPFAQAADYKDIWWNASQSGMGFNITQTGKTVFGAWYFYSDTGQPTFLTFSGEINNNLLSSPLYRNTGPAPSANYDASQVKSVVVGTASIAFSATDNNAASFQYSFEGKTGVIALQRFSFIDNAESLNKDFDGLAYGVYSASGVPANFNFQIGAGLFKLTRQVTGGSCIFEGTYQPLSDGVSARGNYRCTDLSVGTFVAPRLRVTEEGVYVGQVIRTASGAASVTETHTGMHLVAAGVLDFTGKTVRVSVSSSQCSNMAFRANFFLQIEATTLVFSGSDSVITDGSSSDPNFCRSGASVYEMHTLASLRAEDPAHPLVQCLPKCAAASLNQSWVGVDADTRNYRGTVQYTPGAKQLVMTKQVTKDPRYPSNTNFPLTTEVWTFD